ncbi:MAG: hypothetical protein ACRC8C_00085 [Mycoplasmoidaceae bacterium]
MEYCFDNLIIDINGILEDLDDRKINLFKESIIKLILSGETNKFKINLVSTNQNAKNLLMEKIANDIDSRVNLKIFEKDNLENSWDLWRVENNMNRKNTLLFITSDEIIDLLKGNHLFSVFIDAHVSNLDVEKIAMKTSFKKVIELSAMTDEIPKILFKFDCSLD